LESSRSIGKTLLGFSEHRPGHGLLEINGAYTLDEVKQFLRLFPGGPVAVAIGINAFLALRRPEAEALLPDDYDHQRGKIRIHRDTKTGNDEWLPVVAPLAKLLSDGWGQINLRRAEYEIRKKVKGANIVWRVGTPSAVG
jgi:integrase